MHTGATHSSSASTSTRSSTAISNTTSSSSRITGTWSTTSRQGKRNLYLFPSNNARKAEATTPPKHVIRSVPSRSRMREQPSCGLTDSQHATDMAQPLSTNQRISFDHPESLTALPQLPDQAIPQRSSSLRKNSVSQTAHRPQTAKSQTKSSNHAKSSPPSALPLRPRTYPSQDTLPRSAPKGNGPSLSSTSLSREQGATTPRTPRHVPLAPYDPSPLNPLYYTPSPSSEMSNGIPFRPAGSTWSPAKDETSVRPSSEHVQLPSNFQLGAKVHTEVETIFHPAVTQEVVKQHTVKVVRDEISRDLHVHHFCTYVQPVKVVEVLPARHFYYDEETGEKVEIPTPAGWALPADMTPRTWNYETHIRDIKPEYRHYVVDEERPNGELEQPPPEYPPVNAGRKMKTATWSPFPSIAAVQSHFSGADDTSMVNNTNRVDDTNQIENTSRVNNTSRANRF